MKVIKTNIKRILTVLLALELLFSNCVVYSLNMVAHADDYAISVASDNMEDSGDIYEYAQKMYTTDEYGLSIDEMETWQRGSDDDMAVTYGEAQYDADYASAAINMKIETRDSNIKITSIRQVGYFGEESLLKASASDADKIYEYDLKVYENMPAWVIYYTVLENDDGDFVSASDSDAEEDLIRQSYNLVVMDEDVTDIFEMATSSDAKLNPLTASEDISQYLNITDIILESNPSGVVIGPAGSGDQISGGAFNMSIKFSYDSTLAGNHLIHAGDTANLVIGKDNPTFGFGYNYWSDAPLGLVLDDNDVQIGSFSFYTGNMKMHITFSNITDIATLTSATLVFADGRVTAGGGYRYSPFDVGITVTPTGGTEYIKKYTWAATSHMASYDYTWLRPLQKENITTDNQTDADTKTWGIKSTGDATFALCKYNGTQTTGTSYESRLVQQEVIEDTLTGCKAGVKPTVDMKTKVYLRSMADDYRVYLPTKSLIDLDDSLFTEIIANSGESYSDFKARVTSSPWQYGFYPYDATTWNYVQYNGNMPEDSKCTYEEACGSDLKTYFDNWMENNGISGMVVGVDYADPDILLGSGNVVGGKIAETYAVITVETETVQVETKTKNTAKEYTPARGNQTSTAEAIQRPSGTPAINRIDSGYAVFKTDADTGLPIEGAEFVLTTDGVTEVAGSELLTDSDGIGLSSAITPGTYYLKEKTAAPGYDISSAKTGTDTRFDGTKGVSINGTTISVTIAPSYTAGSFNSIFAVTNTKTKQTITYDVNTANAPAGTTMTGGTPASVAGQQTWTDQSIGSATPVCNAAIHVPTGYVLLGWSKTPTATIPEGVDPTVGLGCTYYAIYSSQSVPVTVNYYYQNLDGSYPTVPDVTKSTTDLPNLLTTKAYIGSSCTVSATDRVGNKAGWMKQPDTGMSVFYRDKTYVGTNSPVVFDLYYKAYKVNYDTDGGVAIPSEIIKWTDTVPQPIAIKPSYTFTGWKLVSGGPSTVVNSGDAFSDLVTSDTVAEITLKAMYTYSGTPTDISQHMIITDITLAETSTGVIIGPSGSGDVVPEGALNMSINFSYDEALSDYHKIHSGDTASLIIGDDSPYFDYGYNYWSGAPLGLVLDDNGVQIGTFSFYTGTMKMDITFTNTTYIDKLTNATLVFADGRVSAGGGYRYGTADIGTTVTPTGGIEYKKIYTWAEKTLPQYPYYNPSFGKTAVSSGTDSDTKTWIIQSRGDALGALYHTGGFAVEGEVKTPTGAIYDPIDHEVIEDTLEGCKPGVKPTVTMDTELYLPGQPPTYGYVSLQVMINPDITAYFTEVMAIPGETYDDFKTRVCASPWQFGLYPYSATTWGYVQYNGHVPYDAPCTYDDIAGGDILTAFQTKLNSMGLGNMVVGVDYVDPRMYIGSGDITAKLGNIVGGKVAQTRATITVETEEVKVTTQTVNTATDTTDLEVLNRTATALQQPAARPAITRGPGQYAVYKIDAITGEELSGAEFVLTDASGNEVAGSQLITGTDGVGISGTIADGTYYLKEKTAAAGYDVESAKLSADTNYDGTPQTVVSGTAVPVTISSSYAGTYDSIFAVTNRKQKQTVTYDINSVYAPAGTTMSGGTPAASGNQQVYTDQIVGDVTPVCNAIINTPSSSGFVGWSQNPASTAPEGLEPVVSTDVTYYAIYSYGVTYDFEGAAPIGATKPLDTALYMQGDTVNVMLNTAVTGYDFHGWHTQSVSLATVSDADHSFVMPAAPVVLYGSWSPSSGVAYTVEHYKEDLNLDTYSLADSVLMSGTTLSAAPYSEMNYTGFTYENTKTTWEDSATPASSTMLRVAADGSLVIKLFYKRNMCDISYMDGMTGKVLGKLTGLKYGEPMPAFIRDTTTRYFDGQDYYSFVAWSPSVSATVLGDATYTALWHKDTDYTPLIVQDPPIQKKIAITDLAPTQNDTFTFYMKPVGVNAATAPMPNGIAGSTMTATVVGEGQNEFGYATYTYDNIGTIIYEIGEDLSNAPKYYNMDNHKYYMRVIIGDDGTKLTKSVAYFNDEACTDQIPGADEGSPITFTNTYNKSDSSSGTSSVSGSTGSTSSVTKTDVKPSINDTTNESDNSPIYAGGVDGRSNGELSIKGLPKTGEDWKNVIWFVLVASGLFGLIIGWIYLHQHSLKRSK